MSKVNRAVELILCMCLLVGGNSHLSDAEMFVMTKADSGKEITVACGAVIRIELEEQGGTGYLWQFDRLDKQYFDLIKIETEKTHKENGFTGGPVLKRWQLKAKQAGHTTVKMYYFRPWEDKGQAADRFTLSVRIK